MEVRWCGGVFIRGGCLPKRAAWLRWCPGKSSSMRGSQPYLGEEYAMAVYAMAVVAPVGNSPTSPGELREGEAVVSTLSSCSSRVLARAS